MVCEFPKLWAPASLYNFCTIVKCINRNQTNSACLKSFRILTDIQANTFYYVNSLRAGLEPACCS